MPVFVDESARCCGVSDGDCNLRACQPPSPPPSIVLPSIPGRQRDVGHVPPALPYPAGRRQSSTTRGKYDTGGAAGVSLPLGRPEAQQIIPVIPARSRVGYDWVRIGSSEQNDARTSSRGGGRGFLAGSLTIRPVAGLEDQAAGLRPTKVTACACTWLSRGWENAGRSATSSTASNPAARMASR